LSWSIGSFRLAFCDSGGIPRPTDRYIYPGVTFGGPVPHLKKLTFFAAAEEDAQRDVYAYGSAGSAIIHALVPTANMRTGDFSATELMNYLGPNYQGGAYGNLTNVPMFASDGRHWSTGRSRLTILTPAPWR
jgi:hypothetical protein